LLLGICQKINNTLNLKVFQDLPIFVAPILPSWTYFNKVSLGTLKYLAASSVVRSKPVIPKDIYFLLSSSVNWIGYLKAR
jgi:hypothetical protein